MKAIQLTRSNLIGLANGGKTAAQRLLKIPHAAKAKVSWKAIECYLFETTHFSSAAKLFKHHSDSQPFRVLTLRKRRAYFESRLTKIQKLTVRRNVGEHSLKILIRKWRCLTAQLADIVVLSYIF